MSTGTMERPLHIVQVVHTLEVGGTERVVQTLVRHFNSDGFRTSVCCLDGLGEYGRQLQQEGVTVNVLGRRPGIDVALVPRLRRLYQELSADVVHAHQYTPYFYAAAACLMTPLKVWFTEHGRHQPERLRLKRAVCNQLLRAATAGYTAVSEFTRESLTAFERIPRSRIRLIYNGIDPDGDSPSQAAVPTLRSELGLAPHTKVILSVGRMDRIKDFATLVRAVGQLTPHVPDVALLVAGDGDRAYLAELRALAADLGMNGRVRFLGSRSDVSGLLALCDVFTLTSLTEAASMTILEAMRAGRPVVATDVGGNRELVAAGATGLLVPAGDSRAVAGALRHLLTHPDEAARMGQAGRQDVAARFSLERAFADYRRLYRDTVNR